MPVTPLEPSDPQRLGDYGLTGRLGAGGMGVVYLGTATDGTLVAVKLVRADLAHDPTFRERFRREVEALRRVSGPRVARLIAADTEAPQPYLVVEYVDGPTLADSVAGGGPVAGNRLRALAAALAEAIVVIHEAGVIHRDLKPSNVILAADQPKLVDFGIAAAAGAIPLTVAGTVIGSAGWMAPEQAAGEVSTPAVDVFTWASLVAYAGTGRPPFGTGSPEAVTGRIMKGTPDLDGLPQEVRPFVEAAFIREPDRRPSARALLAGLVGRDGATTDELVAETSQLIATTWVMPPGGWPVPEDRTPRQPAVASVPPPPVAPAPSPPAPVAPVRRRIWPAALVAGLVIALAAAAFALVVGGGGGSDDATTDGGEAGAPATLAPVSVPPTTTTTDPGPPPIDVSVEMTVSRDLLTELIEGIGDIFGDQGAGGRPACADPGILVGIENGSGAEILRPTPFASGERVQGDLVEDCLYALDLVGLAGEEQYVVTVGDRDVEFDRTALSRIELEDRDGLIDLNELFDVGSLLSGP